MENVLGENLPVGIYRTHDKIQNLKIRIKVRKNGNACFAQSDSLVFGDTSEAELVNLMKTSTVATERTFRWQEQVEKGASDAVEGGDRICLFSYTEQDLLSSRRKILTSATCPASPSRLEAQTVTTKPSSKPHFPNTESWQKPLFANVRRIVKEARRRGSPLPIGQSMVILAALFFDDSATSEEIELCFLQVDEHGTLTVVPDFSKKKSYTFVNSRSETFEYEIENVSILPKSSAIEREKHLIKKIEMYKRKLKADAVGTEVVKPEPGTVSFSFNCEIVSAQNFSASDIFVHYLVITPKGWTSESNLEGATETCRSKLKSDTRVAYYGYTFSIDVSTSVQNYESESVKVIFEITSVDYWGNFRNEGYGFAELISTPGIHMADVFTWKIEPTTLKVKLQNYFIGGTPHLEDISYVIGHTDKKEAQLSKYGVQTISSGSITFKANIIKQKMESADS